VKRLRKSFLRLIALSLTWPVFACGTDRAVTSTVLVRINELSPSNHVHPDEYGEPDDWIELYNLNQAPAVLDGYYLSDDIDARYKQKLSREAEVPGHGVLVLWADEQPSQGPLHLNFKLSSQGEGLWLSNPEGYVLDSVEFQAFPPNDAGVDETSLGRYPDGTGPFQWCSVFSPGIPNGDECAGELL
jgi:hypothetical protein